MYQMYLTTEPVAKGRPRITSRGGRPRAYTPAATRASEAIIKSLAHMNWPGPAEALSGPLIVSCTFYLPKPKSVKRDWPSVKPDVDNFQKLLFDALNRVIWVDDAQIIECTSRKLYCLRGEDPYIFVTVTTVD